MGHARTFGSWRRARRERRTPGVGQVRLGDLRRLSPISRSFGYDRGQPIDRYYIASFLQRHADDIRGRVLEIGDDRYTRRFGRGVTRSDVLDTGHEDSTPTIVADLVDAGEIDSDTFDCIVFTQTLQFIYDARAATATLARILRPGGVLLATFPVMSQICRYDMDRWGDYWRFTSAAVRRLLGERFGVEQVHVEAHGNVLAAIGFLHGLAVQDLSPAELDVRDPDYELLIAARAIKPV